MFQGDKLLNPRNVSACIQVHASERVGNGFRHSIYGLALGYEDLNDHDSLRHDLLWRTATDRSEELGSYSTLCRLENRAGRKEAW